MERKDGWQTKKSQWSILFITLSFLSLWIVANASAQNSNPCANDITRFCKDMKPGGGGLARCLREHESELTPACRDRIGRLQRQSNEIQACRNDIDKFCKDIKPGGGRIVNCLRSHASELSPGCQESISQTRKK